MANLGNLIKSHREAKKLSLSALASQVGVAKSYLSMIENQKVNNPPSKSLLIGLEKALDIQSGKLTQIASWEKTPEQVKKVFNQVSQLATRGKELAQWISDAADNKNHNTKSLDQLYKSGQLAQHINHLLGNTPHSHLSDPTYDTDTPEQTIQNQQTNTIIHANPLPTQQIPVINKVAAGYPADFTDQGYPAGIADQYVNCPDISDPDAFACRVIGNSMTPNYQQDDIIVFSPQAKVESGCDCFVRIEPDHQSTFKRVYFEGDDAESQTIRLQPLNPDFPSKTYNRHQIAGVYRAISRIQKL